MFVPVDHDGLTKATMSNLTTLTAIIGMLIAGHLSIYWCALKQQERADSIASGLVGGRSIPVEQRGMMLFNQWMPMQAFLGAYAVLLCFGMVLFARNIDTPGLSLFAYLISAQAGFAALGVIAMGGQLFFYLTSVLREARTD